MSEAERLLKELLERVKSASKFGYAASLLDWDQLTNMPIEEAKGRAEIFAAVKTKWFELFTCNEIGKVLEKLACKERELNPREQALVQRISVIYQRAKAIPPDLFRAFSEAKSRAYNIWVKAREESNFILFQNTLEELIGFVRQFTELWGYEKNPYDALLPEYEPGITSDDLNKIIKPLREKLVPLLDY